MTSSKLETLSIARGTRRIRSIDGDVDGRFLPGRQAGEPMTADDHRPPIQRRPLSFGRGLPLRIPPSNIAVCFVRPSGVRSAINSAAFRVPLLLPSSGERRTRFFPGRDIIPPALNMWSGDLINQRGLGWQDGCGVRNRRTLQGGSRRKDKRSVTDRSIEARPVETLMDATVMVQKLWYL